MGLYLLLVGIAYLTGLLIGYNMGYKLGYRDARTKYMLGKSKTYASPS
jgi:hypothetical protein